jgi:hypothetical protein
LIILTTEQHDEQVHPPPGTLRRHGARRHRRNAGATGASLTAEQAPGAETEKQLASIAIERR